MESSFRNPHQMPVISTEGALLRRSGETPVLAPAVAVAVAVALAVGVARSLFTRHKTRLTGNETCQTHLIKRTKRLTHPLQ
jgi:hypothetical protein